MDFALTADQEALDALVREFGARRHPVEGLAALDGIGTDRAAWRALADLGVLSLRLPDSAGGLGLGWVETVVVLEALGHHLVPGPLVWSTLLAPHVPGVADGSVVVTGVERGPGPLLVEHPALADRVVVLDDDGLWVGDAAVCCDLAAPALEPFDPLTPVAPLVATPPDRWLGPEAVAGLRRDGALAAAALLVGLADRALVAARDHAREREQFDQPIGAFQAVQHLLADMYVRVMLARSATLAAAALLDDPSADPNADPNADDRTAAVRAAKVVAGEAARANTRACVQVHGGMGFTWEMVPHYLLKRAWVHEHAFGTTAEHAERIGDDIGSRV